MRLGARHSIRYRLPARSERIEGGGEREREKDRERAMSQWKPAGRASRLLFAVFGEGFGSISIGM